MILQDGMQHKKLLAFQRITLSEYIRRRRMTATAFNRAFQSVHGVSPTVARAQETLLNAYLPISFSILVAGGDNMNYRIETKEGIRIVGVRTELQEDMEQNKKNVPAFWNKMHGSTLFSEICRLTDKDPQGIFGVTAYINPQNIYYYIAVPTDKTVPDGMTQFEIPAATWVVFECNGHFKESVQTIFKRFLTEWLPVSGYEYAELPDIEVYPLSNCN